MRLSGTISNTKAKNGYMVISSDCISWMQRFSNIKGPCYGSGNTVRLVTEKALGMDHSKIAIGYQRRASLPKRSW
jgi:hypothetical protein